MKCPVCKTECSNNTICPECKFPELSPMFLNKNDGINWESDVVWPWRRKYWATLSDFQIEGRELCKYLGNQQIVKIPYGITKIGATAFQDKKIHKITLPPTIEEIGEFAFRDSNIQYINIPKSVIQIDMGAFLGCNHLGSIVIPIETQRIGAWVFNCGRPRIFCEAAQKPHSWDNEWYDCNWPERWGVFWRCSWEYSDGKPTLNAIGRAQLSDM